MLAIAWALVVARAAVFAVYEHSFFDSDQAVTGLMAKHLSEGRAFPLFMYGQPYLLAVEAWLAVPIFWIAGPTVAALRASLIVTNLAVASLLIVGLHRWAGLRPRDALIASIFFCFPPPFMAAQLVEAGGGNILPFLFVLALWPLRSKPIWFGAVLALGMLTREFTLFALPVIVLMEIRNRTWRHWLAIVVTFVAVLALVQVLKRYTDPMGPGTRGQTLVAASDSQLGNLVDHLDWQWTEWPVRTWLFVRDRMPELLGAKATPSPVGPWEHRWLSWMLAIAGVLALFRARWSFQFSWYILGVGLVAAAAYIITRPADPPMHRYYLLAILIPIGLTAIWLAHERNRWWRATAIGVVLTWAAMSALDHWRYARPFVAGSVPNHVRLIANALEARGVRVAEANYWRAYKITFLTQERVKLASYDYVRIREYQQLAEQEGTSLRRLQDPPCPGGELVGVSFLCPR